MKKCIKCHVLKEETDFPKRDKATRKGKCKTCTAEYLKEYYVLNKTRAKNNYENWVKKNRAARKRHQDKYCENNREKIRKNGLINRRKNSLRRNQADRDRRSVDPVYKLTFSLRTLTAKGFKRVNHRKHSKTQDILGITFEKAKAYLESKFLEGMCWGNHGRYGWHIDHIIPLASTNTEEDLLKLCHYTNLQPLWWQDNFKKHTKMPS